MNEIKHYNPSANIDRGEEPRHKLEIKDKNGKVIAGAEIDYYASPLPYYQITDIWVDLEHQNKGIGTKIMEKIEEMLKQKGRAGFLVDGIMEDSPARGFYSRRGWISVPGNKSQYVYNLPKKVNPEVFMAVEHRQKPRPIQHF